jgi:hypothetical protein
MIERLDCYSVVSSMSIWCLCSFPLEPNGIGDADIRSRAIRYTGSLRGAQDLLLSPRTRTRHVSLDFEFDHDHPERGGTMTPALLLQPTSRESFIQSAHIALAIESKQNVNGSVGGRTMTPTHATSDGRGFRSDALATMRMKRTG